MGSEMCIRDRPVTSSYVISPVTYKFPPTVIIPETATLPVSASIVTAVPTLTPPFAVTIPANAALPVVVIVAPVLTLTLPVTDKISSTVTVPPAESRVKLPEAVSISPFAPPLAILTSPICPEDQGLVEDPR